MRIISKNYVILHSFKIMIVSGVVAVAPCTVWTRHRDNLDFSRFIEAHSIEMKQFDLGAGGKRNLHPGGASQQAPVSSVVD